MIPKFRAWDKHDNSWVNYPVFIGSDGGAYWEHHERGLQEDGGLVISQSTGLKDKNGVEIYEGDIVKIYQQGPVGRYIPNNSINEIVYKDSAFCVKETRGNTDIEWPIIAGLYYKVDEEFEVIGNRFENLEFLEVRYE